jgi:hypothetical protein
MPTAPSHPSDYAGPERRGSNCDNHESNTKDISALKSATNTIRWAITISIPVAIFISGVASTQIFSLLNEIRSDIKDLKYQVSQAAIMNATTRIEVEQLKKDVESIKLEIAKLRGK